MNSSPASAPAPPLASAGRRSRGRRVSRRSALALYAVYATVVLLASAPILALVAIEEEMEDEYQYNLVYVEDGVHSHYIVERWNTDDPGTMEVVYNTEDHKLEVAVSNIRNLTIDCVSLFGDEGEDVFGEGALAMDELYLDYFLQRGTFYVDVDSGEPLETLSFIGAPEPVNVRAKAPGEDWVIWNPGTNYTIEGRGPVNILTLISVPAGHVEVAIDFNEEDPELDTDGDGVVDSEDDDDDGDGYLDEFETEEGRRDPTVKPEDHDGDLIPDEQDEDDDNDGIPDVEEREMNTDSKDSTSFPMSDKPDVQTLRVKVGGATVTVIYTSTGTLAILAAPSPPLLPEHLGSMGIYMDIILTGGVFGEMYLSIDLGDLQVGQYDILGIAHYDVIEQKWITITGATYYRDSNTIAVEVGHLTTFAVVEVLGVEITDDTTGGKEGDTPTDSTLLFAGLGMVIVVIVVVLVLLMRRKRRKTEDWVDEDEDGEVEPATAPPVRPAPKTKPAPAKTKVAVRPKVTAVPKPAPALEPDLPEEEEEPEPEPEVVFDDEEPEEVVVAEPEIQPDLPEDEPEEDEDEKDAGFKPPSPPRLKMRSDKAGGPPGLKVKRPPSLKVRGPPERGPKAGGGLQLKKSRSLKLKAANEKNDPVKKEELDQFFKSLKKKKKK